jgi:hypothetical protein
MRPRKPASKEFRRAADKRTAEDLPAAMCGAGGGMVDPLFSFCSITEAPQSQDLDSREAHFMSLRGL